MIKTCEFCGKEFKTTNSKRKYCCYDCSNKSKIIDLTGKKFGFLTVINLANTKNRNNGGKEYYWLCKCDCGNEKIIRGSTLKNGATQSCGCKQKEIAIAVNTKHNKANTKLYKIFFSMKQRCLNSKNKAYKHYGARGINIYQDWLNNFENFYNWAINNGYKEGLSIDRIDVNGNYEPENCRWVTMNEQTKNTRHNKYITYNNQTKILSDWAREYGFSNRQIIIDRLKRGWSIKDALTTPPNVKKEG